MLHKSFGDFLDKKKREGIEQLGLIAKMLEKGSLKVETFLRGDDVDEPYIFCYNPNRNGSFDGIRIYKVGNQIAFRIQKEHKTHPYGRAYALNLEEMFHDFLSEDNVTEEKAGKKVMEAVAKEIKKFFEKSAIAEKEDRSRIADDPEGQGNVAIRSTSGTDYSALIYSRS